MIKSSMAYYPATGDHEQKLINICFELVLTATEPRYRNHFAKMDNDGKAAWVAEQLRSCGFDTAPCGSNWGLLKKL